MVVTGCLCRQSWCLCYTVLWENLCDGVVNRVYGATHIRKVEMQTKPQTHTVAVQIPNQVTCCSTHFSPWNTSNFTCFGCSSTGMHFVHEHWLWTILQMNEQWLVPMKKPGRKIDRSYTCVWWCFPKFPKSMKKKHTWTTTEWSCCGDQNQKKQSRHQPFPHNNIKHQTTFFWRRWW